MAATVSNAYKQAIYPPIGKSRRTAAEFTYSLTAPDSKDGGALDYPAENAMSRGAQVMNEIRALPAPIATLEPDYWRLDGSFILPVLPDAQPDLETGYWSAAMSDANGYFAPPLVITRLFEELQTFNRLVITFDTATGNCAADFVIEYYDGNELLSYVEEVAGNQSAVYTSRVGGIGVHKIAVTVTRSSLPHRYLRVIELDFGVVLTYNGTVLKSVDMRNGAGIHGDISYPEWRVKIHNVNNAYDANDPESLAAYMQQRQRVEGRIGLYMPDGGIEWVDVGTTWLSSWSVSDNEVELIGQGKIAMLEGGKFLDSSLTTFTIAQLARKIIPTADIKIDSPPITGFFGYIDTLLALSYVAELSCCMVYETNDNIVRFADIIEGDDAPPIQPVDTIDYENTTQKPKVQTGGYYNAINLTEYSLLVEDFNYEHLCAHDGDIIIPMGDPLVNLDEVAVSVQSGYELSDVLVRTGYINVTIAQAADYAPPPFFEGIKVYITGKRAKRVGYNFTYKAPWHTLHEATVPFSVDLPFFIIGAEGYAEFRDWFLRRKFALLKMRHSVEVNWRGNPARDLADCVNAQVNKNGALEKMFVSMSQLTFSGTLSGRVGMIGVNPLEGAKPKPPEAAIVNGQYDVDGDGIRRAYALIDGETEPVPLMYLLDE